jgi:hypothetical protein
MIEEDLRVIRQFDAAPLCFYRQGYGWWNAAREADQINTIQ